MTFPDVQRGADSFAFEEQKELELIDDALLWLPSRKQRPVNRLCLTMVGAVVLEFAAAPSQSETRCFSCRRSGGGVPLRPVRLRTLAPASVLRRRDDGHPSHQFDGADDA